MASALWQVGIAALGTAATIYPLHQLDASLNSRKRKYSQLNTPPPTPVVGPKKPRMAFRRRTRTRRAFRKRRTFRKKRVFRRSRKAFARKVKSVILRTSEPKKYDNPSAANVDLREGDGTSRVTYIRNIWAALSQGVTHKDFVGDSFFPKGFNIRGQVSLGPTAVTTGHTTVLRFTHVFSTAQLTVGTGTIGPGFLELNSGTTAALTQSAGAAVLSPQEVPLLFEGTGTLGYVGNGWVIPFNSQKVRVIKSYTVIVNPGGVSDAETNVSPVTPFNLWFPLKRGKMQINDPTEAALPAPNVFKTGAHYLVIQAIRTTNSVANEIACNMDYRLTVFFKDP
jgi:hypothetical protein